MAKHGKTGRLHGGNPALPEFARRPFRLLRRACLPLALAVLLGACQSSISPQSPETVERQRAFLAQADTARALGDTVAAQHYYLQATTLGGSGVRAHLELAQLYRDSGGQKDVLDILAQAHKRNPAHVEVIKEYAQELLRAGDDAKALQLAQRGLGLHASDIRLLNTQGVALDRLGRHAEAQLAYRKALGHATAATEREYTTNNLALSLVATRGYDEAIRLLEGQLPHAENKPALRQLLAMAHGANGNTDHAYELALIDMDLVQTRQNLAFYAALRDGTADASALFHPVTAAAR